MSNIAVGVKGFEFPQWVIDIYNEMAPEEREANTKTNIYGLCNKINDEKLNSFEICPFISDLSNRCRNLDDPKQVAIAIIIADGIYPHVYLPGLSVESKTCIHCEHTFETRQKDPRCPECQKWKWSNKEPD